MKKKDEIIEFLNNYFENGKTECLKDIFNLYQTGGDEILIKLITDEFYPSLEFAIKFKESLENKILGLQFVNSVLDAVDNHDLRRIYFSSIIDKYLNDSSHSKIQDNKLKINTQYEEYYNSIKKLGKPLEYIIFYEAPPENIDNYILNNPINSHYASVLKKFFSPNNDVDNIADLLQKKNCLFVDIIDIPIKLDKKKYPNIRLFWSLLNPPFTYLLFKQKILKLLEDKLIDNNTKVAIGMPPNSSLGIYNYLPLDMEFYNYNNLEGFYENLIKGNEDINKSKQKINEFPKQRFNSHKSNVSIGQNPSFELLKNAWS